MRKHSSKCCCHNMKSKRSASVLIAVVCAIIFQAWLGAGQAWAAVSVLDPWLATPQISNVTASPATTTFTPSAGTNRIILISVQDHTNNTTATTITVTYGSNNIPARAIVNSPNNQRRQTWFFYLNEADIASAVGNTVTVTNNNVGSGMDVYLATLAGVDQTTSINGTYQVYNSNTTTATLGTLNVNAGGYGFFGSTQSQAAAPTNTESYTGNTPHTVGTAYSYIGTESFPSAGTTGPQLTWSASTYAGLAFATINPAAGGGATQTLDTWTDNSANSTVPVTNLPMATIASTAGSGGVSLTATQVTVGGTVAAADVASVSVLWGATQVGIVNNPASLTNINISLSGAGLSSNNLVYQISLNASAAGKTYSFTVNSVTGSTGGALTLPQTTATMTASGGTCTRSAPTVALSPTSANVTQGGNTTYNVTLTNNDSAACTSSTFTLSAGDSNTTDFNASTLSATIPSPCTIGPAATCTATLTASAKATGVVGNTDTTTVTSTDTTNHNGQNGTGAATSTITSSGGGAQVPAGNMILWAVLTAAIGGYGLWTARRRKTGRS